MEEACDRCWGSPGRLTYEMIRLVGSEMRISFARLSAGWRTRMIVDRPGRPATPAPRGFATGLGPAMVPYGRLFRAKVTGETPPSFRIRALAGA